MFVTWGLQGALGSGDVLLCADTWCNGLYQQIPSGYSFLIQFSTAKRRRNLVVTCSSVHWRRHNSKGTHTWGWAVSDKSTNGSLPRAEQSCLHSTECFVDGTKYQRHQWKFSCIGRGGSGARVSLLTFCWRWSACRQAVLEGCRTRPGYGLTL